MPKPKVTTKRYSAVKPVCGPAESLACSVYIGIKYLGGMRGKQFLKLCRSNLTGDATIYGSNFQEIQDKIPYQLVVFNGSNYKEQLFLGPTKKKRLYIAYSQKQGYYMFVKNMSIFTRTTYYCPFCNVGFQYAWRHNCKNQCSKCFSIPVCQESEYVYCITCRRTYSNQECFINHEKICSKFDLKTL